MTGQAIARQPTKIAVGDRGAGDSKAANIGHGSLSGQADARTGYSPVTP
jgi:hypothetical protein